MGETGGVDQVGETRPAAGRWTMAVRGFLCQGILIGCCFGGFGISLLTLQDHYGVNRGTVALGLSLVLLANGIASPFVGALIRRWGVRPAMMMGSILSVIGYLTLAFAPSIEVVLAAFALPIGLGMAMGGSFPANVLASNWFQPHAGRAVGFVNMPVIVALLPLVASPVLVRYGLQGLYLMFAGLCTLLIPVSMGVKDRPAGTRPSVVDPDVPSEAQALTPRILLRRPSYWMLLIGTGIFNAVSIIGVSHIVAFAVERQVSPGQAALLVSVMGGASVLGSLASGLVCDRIGGGRFLVLLGIIYCASWSLLTSTTFLPVMVLAVLTIGMGGGGIIPSMMVVVTHLYGAHSLPRVFGIYTLMGLPFTFLLPPLAGVLHDAAGGYDAVAAVIIASSVVTSLAFYAFTRIVAQRRANLAMVPAYV